MIEKYRVDARPDPDNFKKMDSIHTCSNVTSNYLMISQDGEMRSTWTPSSWYGLKKTDEFAFFGTNKLLKYHFRYRKLYFTGWFSPAGTYDNVAKKPFSENPSLLSQLIWFCYRQFHFVQNISKTIKFYVLNDHKFSTRWTYNIGNTNLVFTFDFLNFLLKSFTLKKMENGLISLSPT